MQESQQSESSNVSDEFETLRERTHMRIFVGSFAAATALYGLSELDTFPRSTYNALDIHEHAAHLAPGIALGYGFKTVIERFSAKTRDYSTAISILSVGIVASLFETHISDLLWYRNTTKDPVDALYTIVAGTIGAYCLRSKNNDPV